MEKRALLAFALSLLVLFGYQYLFLGPKQEKPALRSVEPRSEEGKQESEPAENKEEKVKETASPLLPESTESSEIPETVVSVETDVAIYRISTKGGVIKEMELKAYHDDTGNPVRLVERNVRFHPLDLLFNGRPVEISFVPSAREIHLREGRDSAELELVFPAEGTPRIRKVLTFRRESYAVEVRIEQDRTAGYEVVVGSHYQESGTKEKRAYRSHSGPVVNREGKIQRIKYKDISGIEKFPEPLSWVAYEQKYFVSALVPEAGKSSAKVQLVDRPEGKEYVLLLESPGKQGVFRFFAGPKDYELLKSQGRDLEQIVNFGFFGFLAKPIFYVLKFFHSFLKSYGVAIILLTTLIKVIFWPLTHKQQKSMKGMQKIQPEMNALREKFKNDPQRMNREVMELYKKHKVNPAAGCLPLVIQIPVFFALYNVLLNAIELRGASFLYIPDLSAADALFGHVAGFAIGPLPLLMGVSMYFQQKMMPTGMDPKQAKIFQYMPVIFTFMFLNFPSGLVLYWLVNNVLTIVQQHYINKRQREAAT